MAKQKFRPTRRGGFRGEGIRLYVEVQKNRCNAVGRTFATPLSDLFFADVECFVLVDLIEDLAGASNQQVIGDRGPELLTLIHRPGDRGFQAFNPLAVGDKAGQGQLPPSMVP